VAFTDTDISGLTGLELLPSLLACRLADGEAVETAVKWDYAAKIDKLL
jgi:hypothetical protein